MKPRPFTAGFLALTTILVWFGGGFVSRAAADEPSVLVLQTNAQVDGEGIFLSQVATTAAPLPHVLLAPAPVLGRPVTLTRAQIQEAFARLAPEAFTTNWLGADRVRVTRSSRIFAENDLKELLTATLQRETVKDRGELEIRFTRPWTPVTLPDGPLSLKILDLPANGVGPAFLVRFELRSARESLGTWQLAAQAKIWKEIWVAQSPLKRGGLVRDADLVRERRDLLALHEPLADVAADDVSLELAESVPAGTPLLARTLKLRPLVRRGQNAEAVIREGTLEVTMKVEVLEDGVPGQVVRARNPISKREIRGKVVNEQTLLITL